MSPLNPEEIKLYRWAEDLPAALWDDLAARPAREAAAAAGAEWDGSCFSLPLLGRLYSLDTSARKVWRPEVPDKRIGFMEALVLVSTLGRALDVPPAERMVTPKELPGGNLFFQGVHAVPESPLEERFGRDAAGLVQRALALGGSVETGADAAVRLPGLPRLPLWVLLWEGDEEFPARAVVGVDARAHHHLALDGILALTTVLVGLLIKE